MHQEIILIAAMDKNRVIGINGKLPWNLPGDRAMFARRTDGGTLIMGRKTYESIIAARGMPLGDGRISIVLTRQKDYCTQFRNVLVAASWDNALKQADGAEEVFVIGGEEIYCLALPYAHRAIITQVDAECEGDAFFPELNAAEWGLYASDNRGFVKLNPRDEYAYQVVEYKKTATPFAVDMDNARIPEQRAAMERIIARGRCPFCPGNLPPEHKQPIEKDGAYWYVTKNQWPYEHTLEHSLIILKTHAEKLSDIPADAFSELGELARWLENEKKIPGGALCMRFGDTKFSAGTVRHIHAQFIVPDTQKTGYKPIWFKIGKDKS